MSTLKAVGVFWDIENCCVPKGKSALKIIERIRERFFRDFREAEFICVCDINKESDATIKDLNDGQINVVHINAVAKNAADDKIRQSLRRFSDSHPPGTKVILISSDVNFASDLSDLRHRKKFDVVLIHKTQVSEALLSCATEHYIYEDLIRDLPDRPGVKEAKENVLVIYGYNKDWSLEKIRQALKKLSTNCGGKVLSIGPLFALLRFDTQELLERAKKRMNGEDVYGRKITVCLPEETSFYNTIKKLTAAHLAKRQESPSPQRRPGRERTASRSFTPDYYESIYGGDGLLVQDYTYRGDAAFGHYDLGRNSLSDNQFCAVGAAVNNAVNSRSYRTPGGHVRQQSGHSPGREGQGSSPSHTHTLPNSNSEKYYNKSGPSSLENSPNMIGTGNKSSFVAGASGPVFSSNNCSSNLESGGTYYIGGISNAATNKMRLADIPIPSFGFRDIPPPRMPFSATEASNIDQDAVAFDPIALIETASLDTRGFKTSKSNLLGPDLEIEHPDSQPPLYSFLQQMSQKGKFSSQSCHSGSTMNSLDNSSLSSSQSSAFTKHPPVPPANNYQNQQHQSRSLSVPAQQADGRKIKAAIEDEICTTHGYSSSDACRSLSQNSGVFKTPATPQKQQKNLQGSFGYQRHQSPGSRLSNNNNSGIREPRKSMSSEGEDRPFSPVNNSSASRQNFRPRLASAPTTGMASVPSASRTPSPLFGTPMVRSHPNKHGSNLYRVPTPAEIGDPSTDYLHPEFNSGNDPYVELIVSNLDYNIHPREWRKIIYATFHPHVKIFSIQVRLQVDHTSVATVRLSSEQDARLAISQFHRRKIGYKRINVQLKSDCSQSPADSLRTDTVALLMEAKDNKMPLSRLIDLFDKRFHKTVSVSDIYKMRDTIQIMELGGAGRWVKLQPGIRRSPTPVQNLEDEVAEVQEQPVCPIHCPEGSVYYTEALNSCMLPNVELLRKHFSPKLHSLLLSHNGYIPLMSFPACFAAEFSSIEPVKEGGIPLEHMISCVPGVELTVSKGGVKVIQFQENVEQFYDMIKSNSWQELGKISREVMELLRQQLTCIMPVSKFIPAYHHYFGKQCRVADYGYTKLQELFEAIPHAIQVLGTGDRKAITLSPRAQLKRFTTNILKVVKAQPAKQILLADFSEAYEKVMGKPLYLPHYGVSYIEDVLSDIPTATLIVIEEDNRTILALPRRDQTPEEVERTKQFSLEVVDLLKYHPQCCMPFTKFIPAYHHHFGRQCRVSDYGFSKLTDLFESIAHIAEIEEDGEERMIHLAPAELRKVLCEQLTKLICPTGAIPLENVLLEYAKLFGFCLKLEDFAADSVKALLLKLKNHIKIEVRNGEEWAILVKEFHIPPLGLQVMQLLMDETGGSIPVVELCMRYESKFGNPCDVSQIKEELCDYVQIDESEFDTGGIIRLTSQQMLGRNLRLLLLHHHNISMSDLNSVYRDQYGVEISPALYGFSRLDQLLLSFPHILELKGKPSQKYIQSAGMLAIPDTLPPSRIDVTSPVQFSLPGPSFAHESNGSASDSSGFSSGNVSSVSDQLRHASQLWDPSMVIQIGTDASKSFGLPMDANSAKKFTFMDLLAGKLSKMALNGTETSAQNPIDSPQPSITLSPNGVPVAWQMKAGGEKVFSDSMRTPSIYCNPVIQSFKSKKKSPKSGKNKMRILSRNPIDRHIVDDQQTSSHELSYSTDINEKGDGRASIDLSHPSAVDNHGHEVEDIFSLSNPSLDTSSSHSQYSSSSQNSLASPVRRKPRIAANFKVSQ